MKKQYFITEKGYSIEEQKRRNEFTGFRIEKVIDYLTESKPYLIPFKIETPLVPFIDLKSFEKQTRKSEIFAEIPRHIQELVTKAEKMKFFDIRFRNYLEGKDISEKEYNNKNPKSKEDLFYDWLFLNNLDVDVLNL